MAKRKKKPWIDKRCCDWDTFLCSFMKAAQEKKFPLLMVDRCKARRDWRRYSMTGLEALITQRNDACHELYFMGFEPPSNPNGQGGNDRGNGPKDSPAPKMPSTPLLTV